MDKYRKNTNKSWLSNRRTTFLLLFIIFLVAFYFISQSIFQVPKKEESPSNKIIPEVIRIDNERLLAIHIPVCKAMGLSESAIDELNQIIIETNTRLQYIRHTEPEYFEEHSKILPPKSSLSREKYFSNHFDRFEKLGLSERTNQQLRMIMDTLYRSLNDPNAYQDPSYNQELAKNLRIFQFPPKCCDNNLYVRAKHSEFL